MLKVVIAIFCYGAAAAFVQTKRDRAHRGVVITSYLTYADDPQRSLRMRPSFNYLANFWNTAQHLGLDVLVIHSGLPQDFIQQQSTSRIRFKQVTAVTNWSTNDYRFKAYYALVTELMQYTHILVCDISDVFFNSNPFLFMTTKPTKSMFLSLDHGRFNKSAWKVDECYKEEAVMWNQSKLMFNAGVWGGKVADVVCVLRCIKQELERILYARNTSYNCNMPVYNWCISHGHCFDGKSVQVGEFVNPWREHCLKNFPVIHNKCFDTENRICVHTHRSSFVVRDSAGSECTKVPSRHFYSPWKSAMN